MATTETTETTGAPARTRSVAQMVRTIRTDEGSEFMVRRLLPQEEVPMLDPFLLLDEAGPDIEANSETALGFLDHAHAGLIAATYTVLGPWESKTASGDDVIAESGSSEWFVSGRGWVHIQRPANDVARTGGRAHSFQLWVDLPNADKKQDPSYRYVPPDAVGEARSDDGKVTARVVSGEVLGVSTTGDSPTPVTYAHLHIEPGGSVEVDAPAAYNALVFPYVGSAEVGDAPIPPQHFAILASDGDRARVSVSASAGRAAEVLFLAGKPYHQPMVRIGPFAAESPDEIAELFMKWQTGELGSISV